MKSAPLTDHELQFIKWRIWEPLRRNQDYRNEFAKLKSGFFMDLQAIDELCEKWQLSWPAEPCFSFDDIFEQMVRGKTKEEAIREKRAWMEERSLDLSGIDFEESCQAIEPMNEDDAKRKIQSLFLDRYEPIFDHAAFVDPRNWIVERKYLKLWIDLGSSRNRIEGAIKKELDEWWSDKWPNFYGGKRRRKGIRKAVNLESLTGKYLELHINLEAPRTSRIEPEIAKILSEWIPKWKGDKEKIPRFHSDKWALCFSVYDLTENGFPFPHTAIKLKENVNTVYKQYKRAWMSIYPGEEFPTKRHRQKEIALETLPCKTCTDRVCGKTGKLCPEVERYVNQDSVARGSVTPDDPVALQDKEILEEFSEGGFGGSFEELLDLRLSSEHEDKED